MVVHGNCGCKPALVSKAMHCAAQMEVSCEEGQETETGHSQGTICCTHAAKDTQPRQALNLNPAPSIS